MSSSNRDAARAVSTLLREFRADETLSTSDMSAGASIPAPAPPVSSHRRRRVRLSHSRSSGGSASGDDSGFGALRTDLSDGDDDPMDGQARSRRRIHPPPPPPPPPPPRSGAGTFVGTRHIHMTQAEMEQARLVAASVAAAAAAPPPPPVPEPAAAAAAAAAAPPPAPAALDSCPVCSEKFKSLYDVQGGGRSGGGDRASKARSAVQQSIVDYYAIIFSVESTLNQYIGDDQLLPMLLKLHQVLVERRAREYGIAYVPWTLDMLRRHFDGSRPHIFDAMREMRSNQAYVKEAMAEMRRHIIEPDPDNPGFMTVNRTAINGLNAFVSQNSRLISTIAKLQGKGDESMVNCVFGLISTLQRIGDLGGTDERMLHEPQQAAGTMQMGGTATQGTVFSQTRATAATLAMYKISGF